MSKCEKIAEGVTLYLGDCREILPTLESIDAVVTDPPYGIAFAHGGNDRSGIGKGKYATKFAKVAIEGDDKPFDPEQILLASRNVVLWGANHYAAQLPSSPCWLIWDKRAASGHSNDFADCELAWCSRDGVARIFRHHWDGMMRASERGIPREHPTQKPIAVMRWSIEQLPDTGAIVDPFMGSGTTGVAAVEMGRSFTGIEIEQQYFDIACRRISEAVQKPTIFAALDRPQEQIEWAEMWSKPFDKPELL